jgi:hypothetical protein
MGNVISDTVGVLNENRIIGRYVKDWALNDYSVTESYPETNQMKKRACCTLTKQVPIGLPSFKNRKYLPIVSTKVDVFNVPGSLTDRQCTLPFGSGNSSFLGRTTTGGVFTGGSAGAEACKNFYLTGNGNNAFCKQTRANRFESYGDKIPDSTTSGGATVSGGYKDESLYGPNPDTSAPDLLLNQYLDCNCENSRFKLDSSLATKIGASNSGAEVDLNAFAQSLDQRCYGVSDATWKIENKKTNLCINQATIGDIQAVNGGKVNFSQTCATGGGAPNPQSNAATPAPTPASQDTPQDTQPPQNTSSSISAPTTTPAPDFIQDNMMYLIIGGVAFLVILIIIFAMGGDSNDPYAQMLAMQQMQSSRRSSSEDYEDD